MINVEALIISAEILNTESKGWFLIAKNREVIHCN